MTTSRDLPGDIESTQGHISDKAALTRLLWAINLASISASVLVYLYLAQHAYKELGSLLVSEFVLFAPMVMPVLLAFHLHRLASRVDSRTLLMATNAAGAVACAVLFLVLDMTAWTVLIGAAVVGALDALQRIARIVAIKHCFSANEVRFTVPLTLTAQFMAGAMAGAILAFFPGQMTHGVAASTAIGLMTIACVCAMFLPDRARTTTPTSDAGADFKSGLSLLRSSPPLRDSLAAFVLLGAIFQGFYNLSRVALPLHHLQLERTQVGVLQIVASLSAVAGALGYYMLSRRGWLFRLHIIYPICALAMLGSCLFPDAGRSFTAYFVYFFCFELAFFRLQSDILINTPATEVAFVATLQYALVYAGMMGIIALGAILLELTDLTVTAVALVITFFVATLIRRRWIG